MDFITLKLGVSKAYLIRDKATILVDAGEPQTENILIECLENSGVPLKALSFILLTHCHLDHIGNATAIREKTGAKIIMHKYEKTILREALKERELPGDKVGRIYAMLLNQKIRQMKAFEPDIYIDDDYSLEQYGINGQILWTPGHTNGSLSLATDEGMLFVGDLLVGEDSSSKVLVRSKYTEDEKLLKKSIQKILDLKPKMIYSAHGGPFEAEEVRLQLKAW